MIQPGAHDRRANVAASVFGGFAVLALAVILGQVIRLQVAPMEPLQPYVSHRVATVPAEARRGDVKDRRGRPVAMTQTGKRIFVDPSVFEPSGENLELLARLTGMPITAVADRVITRIARNNDRRERGEGPIRYVSVGGVLDDMSIARAESSGVPGLHTERRLVRTYPGIGSGRAAQVLVGDTNADHKGRRGLELELDDELTGTPGLLRSLVAADGRSLVIVDHGWLPPTDGAPVRLSIDLAIQRILEEELWRAAIACDAAGARGVVLDPVTGEILAMSDVVREVSSAVPFDGKRIDAERTPRFRLFDAGGDATRERNRAVEDAYEPGSTFKAFTWAAATELGVFSPAEEVETGAVWRTQYGRPIHDVYPKDGMTWSEVLVNSSNIGMAKAGDKMTHAQLRQAVSRLGFGRRTNLGLPGESKGIVPSAEKWSKYSQTSVAFGQEIAVTPLQMVRAFSVFARPGRLAGTLPDLRITAPGEADVSSLRLRTRAMPQWAAEMTRDTLIKVGENMDRSVMSKFPGEPLLEYSLFGKSGTAQIPRPDGRGYLPQQYISSFIAGAPVEDTRIVVLVVVDDPGPDRVERDLFFGSSTAGPAVRRVCQRVLRYLGVPIESGGAAEMLSGLEGVHSLP